MQPPVLEKPIPGQVINERAAYGPFSLRDYITTADDSPITFQAELASGAALPKGLICTGDGILTGIPGKGTEGSYEIVITAKNEAGTITARVDFTIKASLVASETEFANKLKSQIWEALEQGKPVPDLSELYDRPITAVEIYYLLERWGFLTIWNAYDLDPPGEKVPLEIEGVSPHYDVYDRGSCLVATPKDLFSNQRTTKDGIETARALAREAYRREWPIQLAGFDKFTKAAWVEVQHLIDEHGKTIEIVNYIPDLDTMKLFRDQSRIKPRRM